MKAVLTVMVATMYFGEVSSVKLQICNNHTHQPPQETLHPYPVPTIPWQLVFQDLFELNGLSYLAKPKEGLYCAFILPCFDY